MSLPILPSRPHASVADLIRYYYRCDLHWCQQIGEPTTVDVGTAIVNPDLPEVWDANLIFDASLPDDVPPDDAIREAEEHFRAQRTTIRKWVINPSSPAQRTAPLVERLLADGFVRRTEDILHLAGQPAGAVREAGGLRMIPARASFRHTRVLAEEAAAAFTPQVADALILHIEDPQTDALLALRGDTPAGFVTVLTVGELGCITQLFVTASMRRLGIGRTLMSRALEICARSLFKHVFLSCEPDNAPAIGLYKQLGFAKIGEFVCYVRP